MTQFRKQYYQVNSQNFFGDTSRSFRICLKSAGPNSLFPWIGTVIRFLSSERYIAWLPFWREKEKPRRCAARITSFGFGNRGINTLASNCNFYRGNTHRFSLRNSFGPLFPVFQVELNDFFDIFHRLFKIFSLCIASLKRGDIGEKMPRFIFFYDSRKFVYFKSLFHNSFYSISSDSKAQYGNLKLQKAVRDRLSAAFQTFSPLRG